MRDSKDVGDRLINKFVKVIEFCLEKSGERNSGHGGKWHINLTE